MKETNDAVYSCLQVLRQQRRQTTKHLCVSLLQINWKVFLSFSWAKVMLFFFTKMKTSVKQSVVLQPTQLEKNNSCMGSMLMFFILRHPRYREFLQCFLRNLRSNSGIKSRKYVCSVHWCTQLHMRILSTALTIFSKHHGSNGVL